MSDPFDDIPHVEEALETVIITRDADGAMSIESNIVSPAGDIHDDDIVLALLARASVVISVRGLHAADDEDEDGFQAVADETARGILRAKERES